MTGRSQGAPPPTDPLARDHPDGCSLAVRVQPGAKRTAITGIYGQNSRQHLNISVQAPPIEGRANQVLIAYLAKLLSISRSKINIIHGEQDRFKLLLLQGIKSAQVEPVVQSALVRLNF